VITAAFHRDDIERARATTDPWAQSVRFEYVRHRPWHYAPTPLWMRVENSLLKPVMNRAYRLWLGDALALAKELAQAHSFDLVHQLTYVGYRFPGHLWRLGLPFVWGPLGGLEIVPWRLLPAMDASGIVYYAAHNLVNSLHRRFLREPRRALKAAGLGVIAATTGIQTELRRWYAADSVVICEVTAPDTREAGPAVRGYGEPLRLAWSGQHASGKALPLLFRALTDLPADVRWRLCIYGSGPKTEAWRRAANRLGVDQGCDWVGHIPREEAIAGLAGAHLFVITSLKDLTSTVLLEALSQQVPVLCPHHCGFSDVVNAECGIRLPIGTPEAFVAGLREAITGLFRDEARRRQLAVGAGIRARAFGLDAKAAQIHAVYERVLGLDHGHARQNRDLA
jgi:glycosyltransferase involved in cell wall biosynthesis